MHPARPLAALLIVAAGALAGCGARQATPRKPPLPQGDGVYVLRHNPPTCLADRPALHAEVQTALGWERVALEDGDEEVPAVADIAERFRAAPARTLRVAGSLTSETRAWLGSHAARVLRVDEVDPPEPEADPDEAPQAP